MQAVSPTMKKPAYLNDRRAMGLSDRKISLATGKTVPLFRLIFFQYLHDLHCLVFLNKDEKRRETNRNLCSEKFTDKQHVWIFKTIAQEAW